MSDNYILFVLQLANFAPRYILVPELELNLTRKEDYQKLIDVSEKNICINIKDQSYWISNLVKINMVDGRPERTEYSEFYQKILMYAGMDSRNYYIDPQDKTWFDKSINGRCKYLDNTEAYIMQKKVLRKKIKKKGHKIVNSFLILQKYFDDESKSDTDND